MTYRLVTTDGNIQFELRPGMPLVLGRALSSDLPVLDPTISRRHAEVTADATGVSIRDLGSSNGTYVSDARVGQARLTGGGRIVFGKVAFEVRELSSMLVDDASADVVRRAARAGTTIIRSVPVPDADQALELALRASGVHDAIDDARTVLPQVERDRLKLTLLLEISKALTRTADVESLLEKMVQFTFRLVEVGHVSILLFDEQRQLVSRITRARSGENVTRDMSPTLAQTVIEQKVAVLSDVSTDASGATPHGAGAAGPQGARNAACVPLIASEGRVLGVLYVDSLTGSSRVSDEDLDFLVSFAGIGAVALDNIRFGERIRHEALIRGNFERFFTPHLAARIAATPDALGLGGERRNVAVLFADIRGFTELAARMAPEETARFLTEYFTEMVDCVFRHGGTLDKFIGDAVMAQWGAPLSEADDADRALEAALDMMRAVDVLNGKWRAEGRPEIQVGMGLNYGDAFAGYLGSERRLEYTVIGDSINTGSRLCSWAEGGEILVSHTMRDVFTRQHALGDRAPLTLRGKATPVPVFRALR
ncbi:MAG: adenylate/guanylate cyclase domain-containing protein [Gemmatimonadaceae bacterium]|nr:adenylate/guanylate cyclase domain-containing protein [Gemmatimonadaceae bacterium]